jgi:hypothetical protein
MKSVNSIVAAALITIAFGALAQPKTNPLPATPPPATTTNTTTLVLDTDAEQIRTQFHDLLERHPPQVGRVLKLDPALFGNQSYLANYPALAAFIGEHPEIAHSPAYYLEGVWLEGRPESGSERVWRDAMEGFSIFLAIGMLATVLTWLVKTLIQHRRWSRVSRVQADVHNKLMDRFGTNEELLAYITTPAGQRFLESAPLAIDSAQQQTASPAGRILWSIQVGLVLAAAGFGLQFVSGSIEKDVSQPLYALGVLAISIGVGFVLSAIVSFVLSRRLGLWTAPASE